MESDTEELISSIDIDLSSTGENTSRENYYSRSVYGLSEIDFRECDDSDTEENSVIYNKYISETLNFSEEVLCIAPKFNQTQYLDKIYEQLNGINSLIQNLKIKLKSNDEIIAYTIDQNLKLHQELEDLKLKSFVTKEKLTTCAKCLLM
jgi:hypothetical protein